MSLHLCRLIGRVTLVMASLLWACAQAGVMTRERMVQAFPAPLVVGEKERDLPVWPIFKQDLTSTTIAVYAFESQDFAAIQIGRAHV